jgi:hypothetical protein
MNLNYNQFNWKKKDNLFLNPKIFSYKEIFYVPKLFWREIFLVFETKNFSIIKSWYLSKSDENFILKILLDFRIFKLNFFFLRFIISLIYKIKKKRIIYLKKNDFIFFGPFIQNYYHQIAEFLLRLILIKKLKLKIYRIFLPNKLKGLIYGTQITKYIKKIIFFNTYENIVFKNAKYLSHASHISLNKNYLDALKVLKKSIKTKKNKNLAKNQFILISRENAKKRKLLNEQELYQRIKFLGFKRISFESLSLQKQINISRNAKIIIGYHGAGLANIFFMDSKKKYLIEIVNKYYNHPLYEHCSKILNISYKKFICSTNHKNLDGLCSVNEIEEYLKKIIYNR